MGHLLQHPQHVRFGHQVEAGQRLVADQQVRPGYDRPGNRDPLALTAGKLAGLFLAEISRKADPLKGLSSQPFPLPTADRPLRVER